jgi:hypothetical protein
VAASPQQLFHSRKNDRCKLPISVAPFFFAKAGLNDLTAFDGHALRCPFQLQSRVYLLHGLFSS